MKRFTQLVCTILVCCMILTVPGFAAEVMPRASNYFLSHSCYLWDVTSTSFKVCFDVTALRGMEELGASEIKIQRSTDKTNWSTVKTYTKETNSDFICEDTGEHSSSVTYYGRTSGYYYRARVEYYAKDSSGTAFYTSYTSYI